MHARLPRITGHALGLLALLALAAPPATASPRKPKPKPAAVQHDREPDRVTYGRRDDVMRFATELAETQSLDRAAVEAALAQARYLPVVARLIMPPPAGTAKSWAAYRARFVEPERIRAGAAFWQAQQRWLAAAEQRYGVPPEIVIGILGVETYYGRLTGSFRVLDALATLAFDFPSGRKDRSPFFRDELGQFLKLAQREGFRPEAIKGSYAGAIGLGQFMPGSILRHAVDFDGDGHIDMANSPADVIGSIAHYLAAHGWQRGLPTHYPIKPPVDTAARALLLAPDILPSFSAQQLADRGAELSAAGRQHEGPLALVELQNGDAAPSYVAGTRNFYAVTRYNWSSYYALAVIELGQAVAASPGLAATMATAPPSPAPAPTATPSPAATERQVLHALFDAAWERGLHDDPLAATYIGDRRFDALWPDLRRARFEQTEAALRADLAALARIPRERLSAADQRHHDLFKADREQRLAAAAFHPEFYALSPRGGVHTANEVAELMRFETTADVETWLARIAALPAHIDQTIALLREGMAQRRVPPKLLIERVLPQLAQQLVDKPEASPFYARFARYQDAVPEADRSRLGEAARQLIARQLIPAYRQLDAFLRQDYLPACRDSVGLRDLPDGEAFYAERIRFHTSTSLTADQIHAMGLEEVAQIRQQMQQVMTQVGFKGSLAEFFRFLRSDPRFYHPTSDALFRAYVVAAKQIEPELPRLFGKLYRTPFGLRAIPDISAPGTTAAYYSGPSDDGRRAGYFYVNLYRPEMRPIWEIEVLSAHESVPGHHLQIALAQEQAELPKFRRFADQTAFVEGWALYAERLGYELGLYRDPYSRFGQLTYEMWRAVRLVVDTGLHSRGWTRQQAIDYFSANAPKTETDIVNEIDRYIADPGQALAYKIGQRKILALRAQAESTLGERFDVRAFHDAVLANGALPLDMLERDIGAWIAQQPGRAAAVPASGR
ncbi:lytic murein transglycosylase B [Aquabacterium sp.]|uniref:lytic murein transglycosylase B n=1 Tax=Aquabacterium sp. TaxID=1872578 RepID=UPI002B8B4A8F|nr:lytic murein transglycosylase B [Aquabacterium sp.]HSW06784.1 lytic murein transglycosylase B [Aquabacterium sp.]